MRAWASRPTTRPSAIARGRTPPVRASIGSRCTKTTTTWLPAALADSIFRTLDCLLPRLLSKTNCASENSGFPERTVVFPAPVPPAVISTTRGLAGSGCCSACSKRCSASAPAGFCVALLHRVRPSFDAAYSGETISRALSVLISLPNFLQYASASAARFCSRLAHARCSTRLSSGVRFVACSISRDCSADWGRPHPLKARGTRGLRRSAQSEGWYTLSAEVEDGRSQ